MGIHRGPPPFACVSLRQSPLSPAPLPSATVGFWKRYGLLCAHEQIMAKIKPHQVGLGCILDGQG